MLIHTIQDEEMLTAMAWWLAGSVDRAFGIHETAHQSNFDCCPVH